MTKPFDLQLDDNALRTAINRAIARLNDTRPLMQAIALNLHRATERAFDEQGPDWPVLASPTVAAREAAGKSLPYRILQLSGALASSIVSRASQDEAAVGTNLAYAAIHQLGGLAGRNHRAKIPARPYLPIGADKQLTSSVREAVLKTVNRVLADIG